MYEHVVGARTVRIVGHQGIRWRLERDEAPISTDRRMFVLSGALRTVGSDADALRDACLPIAHEDVVVIVRVAGNKRARLRAEGDEPSVSTQSRRERISVSLRAVSGD